MSKIQKRLTELGITLPEAPKPVAAYIPFVRSGNLIQTSGQVPFHNGKLICTGPVPMEASLEAARLAARQCALNCLSVVSGALDGNLDRVKKIVRLGVYVFSDTGFVDQPKVANGASELLQEIFGEAGRHARTSVSANGLPLGATVEIEMTVEVSE